VASPPSKNLLGGGLYLVPQGAVDAAPGHDVRFASQNAGRGLLHVHQVVEAKRALRVIEEEVNVGLSACVAACRRAKQIQVFDAELFQLSLVGFEPGDGFSPFHCATVAQTPAMFELAGRGSDAS